MCCVFQKLQTDLSSDRRLAELAQLVQQLPVSEESKMLADRLDVLSKQHTDTVAQLTARRQALDDCLRRWIDFDNCYQKLLAAVSALRANLDDTQQLTAQDAIVTVEQVSVCCNLWITVISDAVNGVWMSCNMCFW